MNNTTKIITASLLTASLIGTSLTFANSGSTAVDRETIKTIVQKQKAGETLTAEETATLETVRSHRGGHKGGHKGGRFAENLTDTEKTALESMSDEEKKAFFEKKHTEMEAKRDAREAVIDKLLAGQTLTSEEEALRAEIIKERAERKAKHEEMKAKKEERKAIMQKKQAGQTLTAEEQATLDEMKTKHRGGGFGGDHGGEDFDENH